MCKGYITTNQIYFVEGLKKDFTDWLRQYKYARDHGQPSESIFHFRNSKIRKRKFTAGENDYYAILTTLGGGSIRVKRSIELAYLEDSIYEALMQAVPAQSFGAFLSCLYKMKAGEFLWQNELAHCFTRLSL
ncbi:hypothetical protein GCM10008949_45120 [Deinococcus humi]|nr:hypothetical protein GCM10008949_45120 [Deinococcus humi]